MRRLLILTLLLAFVFAGTANAAVKEGDTEISLYGSYTGTDYEDGSSSDSTVLALGVGRFFTDELELGGTVLGAWAEDIDLYALGGTLKYHFLTDRTTVPYFGGQLSYSLYEAAGTDVDGLLYGPLAGMKFFVSENTSLFVEYQYQIYGGDIGDFLESSHALMFGISWLFD